MLVLRRRAGESVLIGQDIEILVLETGPREVKLGIQAPAHVLILRKEIRLAEQQNRAAADGLRGRSLNDVLEQLRHAWPNPPSQHSLP